MKKRTGWIFAYLFTIAGALLSVHWGSRAVTVISEHIPVAREHCIVIDPGHGGVDGGATSCTGRLESSYNLEISLRLRDLLNFMGYDVEMIRITDESVYEEGETIAQKKLSDLKHRVRIANQAPGGILVSIHQNQFSDPGLSGAQVFYADTAGSDVLAERIQKSLAASLKPATGRKEKKSKGVYLMEHIECPGVLIECGFLSNPQEEARLASPDYQKKLCCTIACAIDQFLG